MEKEILQRLDKIEVQLTKLQMSNDVFLDNQEFLQIMNISKRTAQIWRDSKVIPFSQVGAKIYYKVADIKTLLEKNYHPVNK